MKLIKGIKLGLFLLGVLIAACTPQTRTTTVIVVDSSGAPVAGAEVFLATTNPATTLQLRGSTDASGQFVFSPGLSSGDQLYARRRVYEHPSFRPDHGPGAGWVEHVYQTSRVVNDNGSVTDFTVTNPIGTQTLTVSPNNVLIGWHLVASLDWDASDDELNQLATRFNNASQVLYNLTDGQFIIEEVELADDAQLWGSAEIAFQVDMWVWPHTNDIGGFLGRSGAIDNHVYMSPFSAVGSSRSTNPRTLIHELGHLALGLQDEYIGLHPAGNYCTEAWLSGPPGGQFSIDGVRAACVMNSTLRANKLCSAHIDSAHRGGNWQAGPCWNTVAAGYADPRRGTASKDSWVVRTPDARGAVVGTLPILPIGLKPKINVTNRKLHDLCKPFRFVDPTGTLAAGGAVWVRPSFWAGDFTVGALDSNGALEVHGVHLGDKIWTPRSIVSVTSAMCTITE